MRKAILAAVVTLAIATVAAPAALEAAPCPTPNGWSGAANMRAAFDWGNALVRNENGVGVQAGGGMYNAMFGNGTGNGNAGMGAAVARTAATDCD